MREKLDIRLDAIVIPRSFFHDDTFKRGRLDDLFAFIDLISMAVQEPTIVNVKGIPVKLERGEIATSLRLLADRWGCSVNATSNMLLRHEKEHRVIRITSNLTSIISIVNYDQFILDQNADEYTEPNAEKNAEPNTSRTHEIDNIFKFNNNDSNLLVNGEELKLLEREIEGKTGKKKNILLSHASHVDVSVSFSDAADRIYAMYPSSVKRADGSRRTLRCNSDKNKIIRLLKNGHTEKELSDKITSYLSEQPGEYTRMLSTFLNNLPDYSEPEETKPKEEDWRESQNYFWKKDFDEHPDEFKAMDYELRRIINRGLPLKWENGKWIKG